MNKMMTVGFAVAVAGACGLVQAAEYVLEPTWDDPSASPKTLSNAGTWLNAQMASSAVNDVFVLPAGVYKLDVPVEIAGRRTLRGVDRDTVILDGLGQTNCVRMIGATGGVKSWYTYLSTLTVRNGRIGKTAQDTDVYGGAGVYMKNYSCVVTNCVIEKCTGVGHKVDYKIMGGGVYCKSQWGIVSDCVFRDNVITNDATESFSGGNGYDAVRGGALVLNSYQCLVSRCTFLRNRAVSTMRTNSNGSGGGALCNNAGQNIIEYCDFESNEAIGNNSGGNGDSHGGAIDTGWSSPFVTNCCFKSNFATGTGGVAYSAAATYSGCSFIGNTCTHGAGCVNGLGNITYVDSYFEGNVSYYNSAYNGGGCLHHQYHDTVTRCVFINNRSPNGYGGVGFVWSYGDNIEERTQEYTECVFVGNSAKYSGVIHLQPNRCVSVDSCIFDGNVCGDKAAAVEASDSPRCLVRNSFFTRNVGKSVISAGGRKMFSANFPEPGPRAIVDNCTVVGNVISNSGNHAVVMLSSAAQGTYPAGWDGSMLRNTVVAENYKWGSGALDKSAQFNLALNPTTSIGIEVSNSVISAQATLPTGFGEGAASATGNLMTNTAAIAFRDVASGDWRLREKSVAHGTAVKPEWMTADSRDMGHGTYAMTFADPVRKTGMKLSLGRRCKWQAGTDAGCFRYHADGLMLLVR